MRTLILISILLITNISKAVELDTIPPRRAIEYQEQSFEDPQYISVKKGKKYYTLENQKTDEVYIYISKKKRSPRKIPCIGSTAYRIWKPIISMNLKVRSEKTSFCIIKDANGNEWYLYKIGNDVYDYPVFFR